MLPKAAYRFSAVSFKLLMAFFTELEQNFLQFVWKHKDPEQPKQSFFFFFFVAVLVFIAMLAFLQLQFTGFSLQWLLLLWSMGTQALGSASFCNPGTWAQQLLLLSSRAQAQQLWCTGLVAARHEGSSQTRDQIHVSCIDRWIIYH